MLKNLDELLKRATDIVKKVKENEKVCLIHHDDSDGCCSAALFFILIEKITKKTPVIFPISGIEKINERFLNNIRRIGPDFVFIFDVTANPTSFSPFKGFVLDHHYFSSIKERKEMPYLNPRIFEKDDEKVPPTSYMTYRIVRTFLPSEKIAWIAGIGITEDHRVNICKDVFEEIKREYPDLIKGRIEQSEIENSFFGELWDMVRVGRMVKGVEGAKIAVKALVECKDRPDRFINGLSRYSFALRRFYERVISETENLLKDLKRNGEFHRRERVIIYKQRKSKLRALTSYLADKIRRRYPDWIICVVNEDYTRRKAKISIRLEQSRRKENLVELLEKIKKRLPDVKGGGHKSAIGVILDINKLKDFEENFLSLIQEKN